MRDIPQKCYQIIGRMIFKPAKIGDNAKKICWRNPTDCAEIDIKFSENFKVSSGKFRTSKIERVTHNNREESSIFFRKSKAPCKNK